jgi:hypothetical protein
MDAVFPLSAFESRPEVDTCVEYFFPLDMVCMYAVQKAGKSIHTGGFTCDNTNVALRPTQKRACCDLAPSDATVSCREKFSEQSSLDIENEILTISSIVMHRTVGSAGILIS